MLHAYPPSALAQSSKSPLMPLSFFRTQKAVPHPQLSFCAANNLSEDGAKFLPLAPSFRRVQVRIASRHTARILGGQNPERKTPFPFSKEISPPPNQKCKECFSFGVAGVLA